MTSSINSTHKSALTLQRRMSNSQKSLKTNQKLFMMAQKACVFCPVLGALMSLLSQQYAILPLSLTLILMNQINYRRWELLQATEQRQHIVVTEMQRCHLELENRLEQFTSSVKQQDNNSLQYLTKTHLTPIIAKLHQLQRQYKTAELVGIELKELEQQLQVLESRFALINESNTHNSQLLAQVQSELNSRQKQLPVTTKPSDRQPQERVTVFVDAANLYHSATQRGIKIDYTRLLSVLSGKYKIIHTYFYTAVDPANIKEQRFLSKIQRLGFQIVSKEIVRRQDGSVKGNLDLELTLDLVKNLTNTYDTAILLSGDGDFVCAVKHIQECGKRVEVVSFRSDTSAALIQVADSYLDLECIQDQICW